MKAPYDQGPMIFLEYLDLASKDELKEAIAGFKSYANDFSKPMGKRRIVKTVILPALRKELKQFD